MPARSNESDGGSIFDKLIEEYDVLAERAEDMVFQHVCGEIEMELKAHFFRYVQRVAPSERGSDLRYLPNSNLRPFYTPLSYYHRETGLQSYIGTAPRTLYRSPT